VSDSLLLLLHLPAPVRWIALTSEGLRIAQAAARVALGIDANTSAVADTSPPLLTAEAADAMLSVDPQWLLRQAREARIPHVRLGKYIRFDPAAIAEHCARLPHPPATATSAPASGLGHRTKTGGNRR
jgi:hypothetical protein